MTNYESMMKEKETMFEEITQLMNQKTETYQKEMTELENEQLRLQGEYRVLVELLKKLNEEIIEEGLFEEKFDEEVAD